MEEHRDSLSQAVLCHEEAVEGEHMLADLRHLVLLVLELLDLLRPLVIDVGDGTKNLEMVRHNLHVD